MSAPTNIKEGPTFHAQGVLFGIEDTAALLCQPCGFLFDVPADWLRDHSGERCGCPNCGLISELPHPIGA
jgi:hypothetical protein